MFEDFYMWVNAMDGRIIQAVCLGQWARVIYQVLEIVLRYLGKNCYNKPEFVYMVGFFNSLFILDGLGKCLH